MISFDLRDFERMADRVGGASDQIAFALSQSLNDAAFKARDELINHTWPQHVQVRDRNFLRNALRVDRSNKRNLTVAVTSEGTAAGNRAHLKLHETGGTKQARGTLAVPTKAVAARRGAKGVPANLRPKNLKNAFRRGNAILRAVGKGKRRRVEVMYTLTPAAKIKPQVPWHRDFEAVMRREAREAFPKRMAAAMRSRR